jgi:hypothetical protein
MRRAYCVLRREYCVARVITQYAILTTQYARRFSIPQLFHCQPSQKPNRQFKARFFNIKRIGMQT